MRKFNILLVLLLSALLTVSAGMIWKELSTQQTERKEFENLIEIIEPTATPTPENETNKDTMGADTETDPLKYEPEVKKRNLAPLFEMNAECILREQM